MQVDISVDIRADMSIGMYVCIDMCVCVGTGLSLVLLETGLSGSDDNQL